MRTSGTARTLALACAATLLATPARAASLDTSKGIKQLGGSLSFRTTTVVGPTSSSTTIAAGLQPTFGYFVIDDLEVLAGLGIGVSAPIGGGRDSVSFGFDAHVGLRYVFTQRAVGPYVGAVFRAGVGIPPYSDPHGTVGAGLPVGVLVALTDVVALDVGLEPRLVAAVPDEVFVFDLPLLVGVTALW